MPLPEIVAANAPAAIGRRVFVSYSHKDAKLAQAFADALYALAGNAEELGLARERIFFDRHKLLAGDDWSDSIDSDLRLSDLLLFLVSTASLNSRFCLERELKIAAQQGKTIVPVLLSPTPEWGSRKLPGDEQGRTLGSLNAVPLDEKGPQPISGGTWANRSAALAQTMTQIAARLRRDAGPAVVAATAPAAALQGASAARRALPPLLPNLCNQMPSQQSFDNRIEDWSADQALMVLVKGEFPDHTVGFWERLRVKNLADYCEQALSRPLRESRPLLLPRAADAGSDPADLVRAVRRQLSEALTGKPRTLANGEALAALLATDDGIRLLEVTLPQDTVEGTGTLLQALLAVLDDVPAGAMMRLAVAVLVEEPALVAEEKLTQRLGLASARTHTIETRKLQPLSIKDVEIWHRANGLDRVLALSEEQFVRRLFGDAQQLRHLLFDQRVRPLLGLAKEEVSR